MLIAFNIPENKEEQGAWLDDLLVHSDLMAVVSQLSAVHTETEQQISLSQVLGNLHDLVLNQGCQVLSSNQIQQLLTHPELLLELQELMFLEGGEYWQQKIAALSDQEEISLGQQQLLDCLVQEDPADSPAVQNPPAYRTISYRKIGILGFVSAALVLFAVFINRQPDTPPGWGWNRPGALTADVPAQDYLNQLADSAEEWFNKPTETKAALETRIKQFRSGCETLIKAPHPQLAATDRKWLVERCELWAGKLDDQLAALNKGTDVITTDAATDKIIRKLVQALRERAKQVG